MVPNITEVTVGNDVIFTIENILPASATGQAYSFTSSDEEVAVVESTTGVALATGAGTFTVTAGESESGVTATSVEVTVSEALLRSARKKKPVVSEV